MGMILNTHGLLGTGLGKQSAAASAAGFVAIEFADPPAGAIYHWDLTDAAFLYTDAARTSLVSGDGDAVRGVADKGSAGLHIDTDEGGAACVYQHAPATGVPGCSFTAAAENWMDSEEAPALTGSTDSIYFFAASMTAEPGVAAYVYAFDGSDFSAYFDTTNIVSQNTTYSVNAEAHSGTANVICGIMLSGADAAGDSHHKVNLEPTGVESGNVTPATTWAVLGAQTPSGGNSADNMIIYEIIVYDDVEAGTSDAKWADLQTWSATKYGITWA
jgi:hypothetical protein